MILIGPSKGRGVAHGWTSGRLCLGGCKGLIMDPNDHYEDSLEVLMKCRCPKCPQTQHLVPK